MKKTTIFLVILALAFMTTPAWAYTVPLPVDLDNEVTNGGFASGFTGWTNDNFYIAQTGSPPSNAAFAPLNFPNQGPLSTMYQVIDESLYSGWSADGVGKQWWLSFYYVAGGNSSYPTAASAFVYYYTSNPETQPTFGGPRDPGDGWQLLYSGDPLSRGSGTVEMNGEVENFQPRWVALAFEGTSNGGYNVVYDNIEFYGQAVPLPPSVLLLSSGFLGLAALGFRRRG